MYCPSCRQPNPADAQRCSACNQETGHFRKSLFLGNQFVFVDATETQPIALRVNDEVRIFRRRAILSRHMHTIGFGDLEPTNSRRRLWAENVDLEPRAKQGNATAKARIEVLKALLNRPDTMVLPDQPILPSPAVSLFTIVSDRKVYRPGSDATVFIVAPAAADREAPLEIRLAGQKVYEARVPLNSAGLALHPYPDLREGEYMAVVTLPGNTGVTAECTFSVAEFALSPLIAALERFEYAESKVSLTLKLLLLSQPYSGPAEVRLHCPVCAQERETPNTYGGLRRYAPGGWQAPQARPIQLNAEDGVVKVSFRLCGHDGPFRVEVVTPQGHTATVALPGLGATEREHIAISRLGRGAEMGLVAWQDAQPVRGLFVGPGETATTPLALEEVVAEVGTLRAWADASEVQLVTLDPAAAKVSCADHAGLRRDEAVTFDVAAPFTLFTVAAFTAAGPFEGWGVVIRPAALQASLAAPAQAAPGAEIEVFVETGAGTPGLFCWLLAYDARLEHESPLPKLGKRIYESIRDATLRWSSADRPPDAKHWAPHPEIYDWLGGQMVRGAPVLRSLAAPSPAFFVEERSPATGAEVAAAAEAAAEAVEMAVSPARMEFPELVHNELFWAEDASGRTIKLGDQIGVWRVRAYLFRGVDTRELTADVQVTKPLYAELDLPAIASEGDEIIAAVTYHTIEPADLVIATPWGHTEARVEGAGRQQFRLAGPGRVEAQLTGRASMDWSVRDVAQPGVQRVIASRLMILRQNETVRAERVAVYADVGHVLKDTITALIGYPFG